MSGSLKEAFEKLKKENIIEGEYSNLEMYFEFNQNSDFTNKIENYTDENDVKPNSIKVDFIEFSRYLAYEKKEIKQKYFNEEYHTINHWIHNYLLAKEYYKEYGNLKTNVAEVYETHGFSLKIDDWVIRQRTLRRKGQLRENQIRLLDEIEMVWYLDRRLYKDKVENVETTKKSA